MPYNHNSQLWPNRSEAFFRDVKLRPRLQEGPHCVSTSLSILTGSTPEKFQGIVNTQDPLSWSDKLKDWGMKLAYCPSDVRRLRFHMDELIQIDDLFTLSYYTTTDEDKLLADPDDRGWITGSHIVVMHRDMILDPARGDITPALEHHCNEYHTKRIFRVVPADYLCGPG